MTAMIESFECGTAVLTNAPAAFQDLWMTFHGYDDVIGLIYLDDILIYSDNISEPQTHVQGSTLQTLH